MEQSREKYLRSSASTSAIKLHWRATTVPHSFHMLPGDSLLELGAGSGLWTEHLAKPLGAHNQVTAAIFNHEYLDSEVWARNPGVRPVLIRDLSDLPGAPFDYVVGTGILCHDRYSENLQVYLETAEAWRTNSVF
jgi:dolichol-phosphate mannosyltransferase